MNEHLRADEQEHLTETSHRVGFGAVEKELFNETSDTVQVGVYVNGRMIHTKTDSATVARIMALLTGTD